MIDYHSFMTGQSNKSESAPDKTVTPRVRRKDRVLKRSRAARDRRAVQDKKDFRLVAILLQVSVLGAFVLAALGITGERVLSGGGQDAQSWIYMLSTPVFLGLSAVELGAALFFCVVVAAMFWRVRAKR